MGLVPNSVRPSPSPKKGGGKRNIFMWVKSVSDVQTEDSNRPGRTVERTRGGQTEENQQGRVGVGRWMDPRRTR